jgi:hypothetical protein
MLATFYAKAWWTPTLEKPILGDRWARDIVDRIDYDWSKTGHHGPHVAVGDTRSAHFDNRARQLLAVHPRSDRAAPWLWTGQPVLPARPRAWRVEW